MAYARKIAANRRHQRKWRTAITAWQSSAGGRRHLALEKQHQSGNKIISRMKIESGNQ